MKMNKKHYVALAIALLVLIVAYLNLYTGTVVDAETEKPIDGAVVLVEWTIKTGPPGLATAKMYKRVEKVTNKKGKFSMFGVLNPFVNPPLVVVYKKGYVAWRSDFIFPDYAKREDFHSEKIKLEHFSKRYSHSRHIIFFQADLDLNSSSKLYQAYSWEDHLASKEEELLRKKRKAKKPGTYSEKELWAEIADELYSRNREDENDEK